MSDQSPREQVQVSLGRIVFVIEPDDFSEDKTPRAAIVSGVGENGMVDVTVFLRAGAFPYTNVPHDENKTPFSWHWPPRVGG